MPNPAVLPPTENMEADGCLELGAVLSPGPAGQSVLLQGLPPGRGFLVRSTGPVGVSALLATQTELSPSGVVQREDELPPSATHQAAASQVWKRQISQDHPPQLNWEAAYLHGSRDTTLPPEGNGVMEAPEGKCSTCKLDRDMLKEQSKLLFRHHNDYITIISMPTFFL